MPNYIINSLFCQSCADRRWRGVFFRHRCLSSHLPFPMPTSILKKTTADDNVSNASEHNHRNSIISTSPTLAEEPNHDTDEHSPSPSSRSNTTTYPSQATTQLHAESHPSDPPPRSIYTRIFKAIAPDLPVSIVLENAGSVARDHLANERTWLAYVRTSLAIAGTGVGVCV